MIQCYNHYSTVNGLKFLWTNLKFLQCQPSGRIWVCHSYIHTGHRISTPWGGPCLELVGHIQMGVSKALPVSSQAGGGCCKIHILNVLHNTTMSCLFAHQIYQITLSCHEYTAWKHMRAFGCCLFKGWNTYSEGSLM